jgi:hypothetical protein
MRTVPLVVRIGSPSSMQGEKLLSTGPAQLIVSPASGPGFGAGMQNECCRGAAERAYEDAKVPGDDATWREPASP